MNDNLGLDGSDFSPPSQQLSEIALNSNQQICFLDLLPTVRKYFSMAELEDCMPSGDPQRAWFPEMIQKLRLEWHESMPFPDLIALRDSLDNMLHEIRSTRNIHSPIVKCPKCEKVGPGAEPRVGVRAMILSLSRFKIADPELTKILEKQWAAYRENNRLDLYGKANSGESVRRGCGGSNDQ